MNYYFHCPKCGSNEAFFKPSEEFRADLLLVTRPYLSLLMAGRNAERVQCANCFHIFPQPPLPQSPPAVIAWSLLLATFTAFVVAVIFASDKALNESIPEVPFFSWIQEGLVAQPRVESYLVVTLLVLLIVPWFIAGYVGNRRFRREMSALYRLKPARPSEVIPTSLAPTVPLDQRENTQR